MEPIVIEPGTRRRWVRVEFRAGPELRDRIQDHADRLNLSRNELMTRLLEESLNQLDRQQDEEVKT